jgi:putative endonuclease
MADARKNFLSTKRAAEKRGRRSETLAALLLMLKGYRILERRARTPLGEIDLIARSPAGVVCFVEVKSRAYMTAMPHAFGERQRARIARAAALYMARRPGLKAKGVRFDMVTVAPGALPRHMPDAWRPS